MINKHGVKELNPLTEGGREFRKQIDYTTATEWDAPNLYITRLRLLGDWRGYDVSYVEGVLNGQPVRVSVPFSFVPRNYKRFLYVEAKKTGGFIEGLFENISILG